MNKYLGHGLLTKLRWLQLILTLLLLCNHHHQNCSWHYLIHRYIHHFQPIQYGDNLYKKAKISRIIKVIPQKIYHHILYQFYSDFSKITGQNLDIEIFSSFSQFYAFLLKIAVYKFYPKLSRLIRIKFGQNLEKIKIRFR